MSATIHWLCDYIHGPYDFSVISLFQESVQQTVECIVSRSIRQVKHMTTLAFVHHLFVSCFVGSDNKVVD